MSSVAPMTTAAKPPRRFAFQAIGRLIWHQARTTRGLWFLILLLDCGKSWLLVLSNSSSQSAMLATLLVTFPVLYAIVGPALAFSQEWESRTRSRLLMLPTNWLRFVSVTMGCIFLQTLVLYAMAWLNRTGIQMLVPDLLNLDFATTPDPARMMNDAAVMLLAMLCGFVGALLSGRTLIAVLGSGLMLLAAMGLSTAVQLTGPDFVVAVSVVTPLLFGLNLYLARHWFVGGKGLPTIGERSRSSTICPRALAGLGSSSMQSQSWRDWRTLVWREAASKGVWFAILVLLVVAINPAGLLFPALPLATLACGFFAFRGEQFQDRIRCLSERGISPTVIWLSKHRIWIPRAVMAIAMWPLSKWLLRRPLVFSPIGSAGVLAFAVATYAVAQFCSVFIRGSIAALGAAVVLSFLTLWWGLFTVNLSVPMWVSLLPLVIGMFVASWVYCQYWAAGQRGFLTRWSTLGALAAAVLCSYIAVGFYRVYEVPATFVSESGWRSSDADRETSQSVPALPTEAVKRNTARFHRTADLLSQDLISRVFTNDLSECFHRLDQAPADWENIGQPIRAWTEKNQDSTSSIVAMVQQGEMFFASNESPSGEHYLPLLLLEYEGARRQAAGDYAGAQEMYAAAIKGYWLTVHSDQPGQDVQNAYAAVGHIFRRLGALGCEMQASGEPGETTSLLIRELFKQRPSLSEVSQWTSEWESRAYEILTTTPRTVIFLGRYNRARKTVFAKSYQLEQIQGPARRDWFTFGVRSRRITNLLQQARLSTLESAEWNRHRMASYLDQAERTWNGLFTQYDGSYLSSQAIADNNPARWLYAETDLVADVMAAHQLIAFAKALRGQPNKQNAARDFCPEFVDPWRTRPRNLTGPAAPMQWHPHGLRDAMVQVRRLASTAGGPDGNSQTVRYPHGEDQPMFVSVGGPPDVHDSALAYQSGGRRYYHVPQSVVKKWRLNKQPAETDPAAQD